MSGVCRRKRRLFLCLLVLTAGQAVGQTVPMTTIQDTVFRADGNPAQGTLLISWPEFTASGGQAIAAGSISVNLGAGGVLSVELVPNTSATPPNTVYTVVYQLDDVVKTEYWVVPTASPATLAQVRTTLGASGSVAQMATQQFVNAAVAAKANDSTVVHLTGAETITGLKQFSVSPSLPNPVQSNDAANKAYVDTTVQNVGSGSYLSTAGGTMTGALVLSGDPAAPNQASDKHYVDLATSVKADLIAGFVPASELASGTPSGSTCLLGNQTWGACGAGGSSSYVNSTLVANPNFNAATPPAQSNFLNCLFRNSGSNVSLECPYGNASSTFALGSQAVLNNQANTFGSGLQDFTAAGLKLPSGASYAPAIAGAIGFDTNANAPVINISGVTQQLALTTSNISGQANTALALANPPSQCNGSFATGIQANGNANCSTADVIQLAETVQPPGLPNYGLFWFDSATHTPRVIDNNGQVVQLALMNVFNSDANTLEEYNGTSPQTLNVYGTRSDAADYERVRLGYDTADGYFVVGAEAAGTGQQRGLGFWLQGSLRWVIDNAFNFKPWSDNVKDIGAATLRVKHLYLGTYADLSGGGLVTELANQAVTGTTLNKLAKITGSPAMAIIASTSDTSGVIGVAVDGAGTTGNVQIARDGQATCAFDGPTTAGDYVQISGTVAGDCHDAGASYPGSGQVLGRVLSTNAAAGLYAMLVAGAELQAPIQAVASVFGRNGTVTAQSGDYSVSQVTGAAPLASPAFTGTPTAPTPSTTDNSTRVATTAWVLAQNYGSSSGNVSGPTSSVTGDIATFNGSTGKTIQDSGIAVSALAPLASPAFTGSLTVSGTGAGALGLSQGSPVSPIANTVQLMAPAALPVSGYQAIVPQAGAAGVWHGTYGNAAAGTVSESGGQLQQSGVNITSGGSGYSVVPACYVTGGGGSGGACTAIINGGAVTGVMITSGGSGYTGTATLNFANQVQIAFGYGTSLASGDFTIGSGWGSTAALSNITGTSQAFNLTVTASGSGIAANPTLTLTFHSGAWMSAPVFLCQQTGGTGVISDVTLANGMATSSALPMIWNGTAIAGSSYIFSCIGAGAQ